jgi:hypothetical protein
LKQSHRLTLRRESLTELSTDDLSAVAGGAQAITGKNTECLTPIIDPPSNTYVCTDTCFRDA